MTSVPTHRLSPATTPTSTDPDGDWRHRAACLGEDGDLFFAEDREREPARSLRIAAAKAVCRSCPVTHPCLTDALRHNDAWAVRGGLDLGAMSQRSRYRLRDAHGSAA